MHETGCSRLIHWDDPEGWDGEGGRRGVQDGEHMYTHGGFMSKYGNTYITILYNIVYCTITYIIIHTNTIF